MHGAWGGTASGPTRLATQIDARVTRETRPSAWSRWMIGAAGASAACVCGRLDGKMGRDGEMRGMARGHARRRRGATLTSLHPHPRQKSGPRRTSCRLMAWRVGGGARWRVQQACAWRRHPSALAQQTVPASRAGRGGWVALAPRCLARVDGAASYSARAASYCGRLKRRAPWPNFRWKLEVVPNCPAAAALPLTPTPSAAPPQSTADALLGPAHLPRDTPVPFAARACTAALAPSSRGASIPAHL